jgi:hypothetical protein
VQDCSVVISLSQLQERFRLSDLFDQFYIDEHTANRVEGWRQKSVGGFNLCHHPDLPVTEVTDEFGNTVGLCIGYYVNSSFDFGGELRLTTAGDVERDIDAFLSGVTGRYVVLLSIGIVRRLYLDPCGSLPAVYAPDERTVAASPALIPYSENTQDNKRLMVVMNVERASVMYAGGVSPRHGVFWLLPSHYLDLNRWVPVRHWPKDDLAPISDTDEGIGEIAELLSNIVCGLSKSNNLQVPLTAGWDSRLLLACCRDVVGDLNTFTYDLKDRTSHIDCLVARGIAKDLGIPHLTLSSRRPTDEERLEWLFRTGLSVGDPRAFNAIPLVGMLHRDRASLPGVGCELGRAYYRERLGIEPGQGKADVDLKGMFFAFGAPMEPELVEALRTWRDELPTDNGELVGDFFFLEQVLGCWSGILTLGFAGSVKFEFWPFNNRRIIDICFRFPESYKRSQKCNQDIIRIMRPELLRFRINRPSPLVELLFYLKDGGKAVRKRLRS